MGSHAIFLVADLRHDGGDLDRVDDGEHAAEIARGHVDVDDVEGRVDRLWRGITDARRVAVEDERIGVAIFDDPGTAPPSASTQPQGDRNAPPPGITGPLAIGLVYASPQCTG